MENENLIAAAIEGRSRLNDHVSVRTYRMGNNIESADDTSAVKPLMVTLELIDKVSLLDVEVGYIHQLSEKIVVAKRRRRFAGRAVRRRTPIGCMLMVRVAHRNTFSFDFM
jgi:hypothetical protein